MGVHAEIMADQVVDVRPHDLSRRTFLLFPLSDQIVIEWIEKIVPVQFVRAGIAFPVIAAIGRLGPARFIDAPIAILLLLPKLIFDCVTSGVWVFIRRCLQHGSRNESPWRFMFGTPWRLAQETQSPEGIPGPALGLGILRGPVGKTFTRPIHARPMAVIVTVTEVEIFLLSLCRRVGVNDVAELGSAMVPVDLVLVVLRLFRKGHTLEINERQAVRRGDPGVAARVHGHVTHLVAWQPALPLPVCPSRSVKTNRTNGRTEPHRAIGATGHGAHIVIWQTLRTGVERPCPFPVTPRSLVTGKPKSPQAVVRYGDPRGCPTLVSIPRKHLPRALMIGQKQAPLRTHGHLAFWSASDHQHGSRLVQNGTHCNRHGFLLLKQVGEIIGGRPLAVLEHCIALGSSCHHTAIFGQRHGPNIVAGQPLFFGVKHPHLLREHTRANRNLRLFGRSKIDT